MSTQEGILDVLTSIYPFRGMADEDIRIVADHLRAEQYDAGDVIYQVGDPADNLYIMYSGNVRLLLTIEAEEEVLATHKQGDFFGHEVLEGRGMRQAMAVAVSEVTLLAIDADQLVLLADKVPDVAEAFELMAESFRQIMRMRFPWLGENEAIYYLARRHIFFLIGQLILLLTLFGILSPVLLWLATITGGVVVAPLIVTGVLLIVFVIWLVWIVVDWSNDFSIITSHRVLFRELIVFLYDSRREAPLSAILSVATETSLIGRILGYGDVIVRTFTGMITLRFVRNPNHVARIVEAEWYRASISLTRAERAAVEHRIREIVGISSTTGEAGQTPPQAAAAEAEEQPRTNWFTRIFADLIYLRFERDGAIIYRKHWWILLKRTLLPTTVLAALIVGVAFYFLQPLAILSPLIAWTISLVLLMAAFGWWLYEYVDWRNDIFMITDDQVLDIYRKPLAREERRVAPLGSIQSIEFARHGLIGLLLNFGTVYIRVGDTQLTFDEVFNPSDVQSELFNRIATREYRQRLAEQIREQDRMSQWLSTYHRLTHPEANLPSGDEGI
ncbi:MAG TPA: cyclic nucleotide-binding domain-containing protein [Levilinea sp.]|nr:cyclic nucleotide-binding domain-containing protein [Levilinea sp.]